MFLFPMWALASNLYNVFMWVWPLRRPGNQEGAMQVKGLWETGHFGYEGRWGKVWESFGVW